MHDPQARRAHQLLKQAVELDAARRPAFVNEQCDGDTALRERVMALLRAITQSHTFLEAPALSQAATRAVAPTRPIDTEIAGYRIERVIGEGGMARVYEAIQQRPHRRVALKVMNRGIAQPSAVQRFLFETEVLAKLRHPNIAQIYESGSFEDGTGSSIPFFAMEFIPDARPITLYADEQRFSLAERLRLAATVCDAVQHGHQNGVIHRDLKPGNVLVDTAGHVKVIDFGIARSTDPEQAWITRHADLNQLIGTLNYMSPEQCAGASNIDARSDVYALGMILYELMCDRLPHDLTQVPVPEALRIVQREAPPRPSAIKPELKGDIEAIILKAIDKDPDRRYGTAAALAADIHRFLRHESIEARPPTLFYQARLFTRRHKALVIGAAGMLLAVLLGAIVSARFAFLASQELKQRQLAELEAKAQRDAAIWRSYVASMAAAGAAVRIDELQFARSSLAQAPEQHRNWEWSFLHGGIEEGTQTIQAHDDMVLAFDVSRDQSRFVTGSRDGTIRTWDAATRTPLMQTDGIDGWILSVSFSPDGKLIASGGSDHIVRLWDAESGAQIRELGRHRANVESVAFSMQGVVVSTSAGGACSIWNSETGELVGTIEDQPGGIRGARFSHAGDRMVTWNQDGVLFVRRADGQSIEHRWQFPGEVFCAAFSHDDQLLAVGGARGAAAVWNVETGEVVHPTLESDHISSVRSLAFTPDDRVLAIGQSDRQIRLWSMDTGEMLMRRMKGHEETVAGLAFSADGTQLVSVSWDRTMRVWEYAGPRRVEFVSTCKGHKHRVLHARFSPDQTILASGSYDHTIRLWDPETATCFGVMQGHRGAVSGLAFSPDGKHLASASYDRTVRIWNMETGAEEAVLAGHTGQLWSVAYRPDGKQLASAGNDATIRLWDLASSSTVHILQGHTSRVTSVAFSPDGKTLASASRDHTVRIWDVATGEPLKVLEGHNADVYAVLFDQTGRTLYSGSRDQSVRIWDAATGRCLHVLEGHGQVITSLTLNATGDRLAAGSWYGEVVLWDVSSLDVVLTFKAHTEVTRSVTFSADGRWLVSTSFDGTVRLFDRLDRSTRLARREVARRFEQEAESIVLAQLATQSDLNVMASNLDADASMSPSLRPFLKRAILRRRLASSEEGR